MKELFVAVTVASLATLLSVNAHAATGIINYPKPMSAPRLVFQNLFRK